MRLRATHRWEVHSAVHLRALAVAPLGAGGPAPCPVHSLHRDVYLDTDTADLRTRGVVLRLRTTADDRHTLTLSMRDGGAPGRRIDARCRAVDAEGALRERNAVTRRLAGIVDPARVAVRMSLEVERFTRTVGRRWLGGPRIELRYEIITVRRGTSARTLQQATLLARDGDADAEAIAGALARDAGLRPAGSVMERAELLLKWMPVTAPPDGGNPSPAPAGGPATGSWSLHPELSFLQSQHRVVALAEDVRTPIGERLRFIGIVAANLDEFFMVRVAGLRLAAPEVAEESTGEWGDIAAQLGEIAAAARALQARHSRAAAACVEALAGIGVRVRSWTTLTPAERESLREAYREDIHPALTPLAMTMSPGHPFPRLPHLSLSIAAVLRDGEGRAPHFAHIEIPDDLPRMLPVDPAGGSRDVIPVEEVVRANLGTLYPGITVEQAYVFRVTRSSMLALDEANTTDFLEAMDDATQRRPHESVVRVEVEQAMPPLLRELVLDELGREAGTPHVQLAPSDVYETAGLLDLRSLAELRLPDDASLHYPRLVPTRPVPAGQPMLDAIAQQDLLVHHPFESFEDTVVRFVREAAVDPDVTTMKMTLYRVGEQSPIVDALRTAASGGKQVYAFVELRARFDEARNVKWVRALEKAGVRVAYGLVGVKTHAKAALVVRREAGRLRRYVHVGTGNYNARTGLAYTDLSLFTADERLTSDISDLFNNLTGSTTPPDRMQHGTLVAPSALLAPLLQLIEAEGAHARAGRRACIRLKVNGLSDAEVVRALEAAARDGVQVDLVVRGICTLRPTAGGNVRVVATTGRFLEHSRIYRFENGGQPLYFLGSADLRPRNLRRRVEVLAPVRSDAARERLDALLDRYLEDPSGWDLAPDGTYVQRSGGAPAVQDALLEPVPDGSGNPNAKREHALDVVAR